MKTKSDFFSLLDSTSGVINGETSKDRIASYIVGTGEYVSQYGLPIKVGGVKQWIQDWRNENRGVGQKVGQVDQVQIAKEEEVKIPDPKEGVIVDRMKRALTAERDEAKRKYKILLDEIDLIEKRYDTLCAIKEPINYQAIEPNYKQSTSEAIAVAQLSDIHVGEKVDPETVNGLNEFNPDICDKRVYNYFQNLLRLIESGRRDSKIETLFLSLTGDNITGFIHEELMQTNYMSPTEEVRFAKRLLIRGIDFLLNHGKFKKIFVQTNFGNHGRNTKRTGYGSAYKNSYDFMLYCDIADYYKNTKELEFNISKSHICYSPPMFGKIIRTFHGDTFNYAGGIGGLTVPLIKYIHRLDQQLPADMNLIGHYHQFFKPLRNCVVNGSIIGINAYAQGIGCAPEPPQQSLMFLDKSRGFTSLHPVFCD